MYKISSPYKAHICALIVTFHPSTSIKILTDVLSKQLSKIIIVDNGSDELALKRLTELSLKAEVELILLEENYGIAKALNDGIKHAEMLGYEYVVLFDQDSDIDDNFIEAISTIYNKIPNNTNVATLGAEFRDLRKNKNFDYELKKSGEWKEVKRIITSGSLIPMHIFKEIGMFKEDLFIYYVDNEFCKRAITNKLRVIKTTQPLMTHTYGTPTERKIFNKVVWVKNYSATSWYYITRNYTYFLKEYGDYKLGLWAVKSFFRAIKHLKLILLFEENKLDKIHYIFEGWIDGLRSNLGKRHKKIMSCQSLLKLLCNSVSTSFATIIVASSRFFLSIKAGLSILLNQFVKNKVHKYTLDLNMAFLAILKVSLASKCLM